MSLAQVFMRATQHMADGHIKLSDSQRRSLYGLQKQAIDGNCDGSAPPKGDAAARGKYDAWVSCQHVPRAEAMQRYIAAVREVDPSFQAAASSPSASLRLDVAPAQVCVCALPSSYFSRFPHYTICYVIIYISLFMKNICIFY